MNNQQKTALLLLRVGLGFLFLYAGISKIIDPSWTSAGYVKSSQLLSGFYQWLGASQNIIWVDFLNEWGLLLMGAMLMLGFATRIASFLGGVLMVLYYIPILKFPYAGHGFLVDEHIIYILGFFILIAFNAGTYLGIDGKLSTKWKKCLWCK